MGTRWETVVCVQKRNPLPALVVLVGRNQPEDSFKEYTDLADRTVEVKRMLSGLLKKLYANG